MTFEFLELYIKDWMAYGGETVIEFPRFQEEQNLIAIHGQNGFGKTSLLKALQFLFHDGRNREEQYAAWHERSRNTGEGTSIVRIKFLHNERVCQLTRYVEFTPWGDNNYRASPEIELIIDGNEQTSQVQDKIEQIIPSQCQQFIFFDGAQITRYAQPQHQDTVKDAIELFLGIPAVRNLRDDLSRVIRDLEREQETIIKAETQSETLLDEIANLQEQRAQYEERLERQQEKKGGLEAALRELDKEEAQLQIAATERELLSEKQARKADLEGQRKQITEQIETLIKNAPIYMLVNPLEQIVADLQIQQEIPTQTESLKRKRRIVENLLGQEYCICGREIDSTSRDHLYEEAERLLQAIEDLETNATEIGSRASYLSNLQVELRTLKDAHVDGQNLIDQRSGVDVQLAEISADISKLKDSLTQHDMPEIRDFYQQRESLDRQIKELKQEIESVILPNLTQVKGQVSGKQREADQIAATTDRGASVTRTLNYIRNLHQTISTYVEQLVEQKRAQIEQEATRIFKQITNKPYEYAGVFVDANYSLSVYRHDDSVVSNNTLSAGEKEVLSYSFITALNLCSPTPAPFVMDTPFGHLDSDHRKGLLESLPKLPVQMLLLATDRDLPREERERVQDYLAAEFFIRRDQQRATSYIEGA